MDMKERKIIFKMKDLSNHSVRVDGNGLCGGDTVRIGGLLEHAWPA